MPTRRLFNHQFIGLAGSGWLAGCASTLSPERSVVTPRPYTIDTHAHVFTRALPMPDPRRAPSGYDATPRDYLEQLDRHVVSQGVLVQPSFLGTDNAYLVAALRAHPERLRGIAVVAPGIDDAALQRLDDAGVVGIRLNLIGLPAPRFADPAWKRLIAQVAGLRWQVEVHQVARELQPVIAPLIEADIDVVVDHFGRPDPTLGVDDPGFRELLRLGASRRVWVKLSGAYRNGDAGRGEATAVAATPMLHSAFGLDRLMWGSDWPHTLFESTDDYDSARAGLDRWMPSPADRRVVLGDTPSRLFRFDRQPATSR